MKFLLSVRFEVEPVLVEVEAETMAEAWANRFDLAADAVPVAWENHPQHIEEREG